MPATARYLVTPVDQVIERVRAGRSDTQEVARLVALLRAVLHVGYDARWQAARRAFDSAQPEAVLTQLRAILASANYTEVPREVLHRALGTSAVSRVRVQIDLEKFDELVFFRRTVHQDSAMLGRWRGWKKRDLIRFDTYDRVVMYARYRDQEQSSGQRINLDDRPGTADSSHLKLYQDVPEPDLEMLVPGIEVTMRTLDKVVLGVPAVLSGIVVAITKLGAALVLAALVVAATLGLREDRPEIDTGALVTLLGGGIALGGFLWRQWSKIRTRRVDYLRRLSESLYLKTLADGPQVLFALLDASQDQDLKEALLAYRAVLDGPCCAQVAAARVEKWLDSEQVSFQVADALARLAELGVVRQVNGTWTAVPPAQAVPLLQERWRQIGDHLAGTSETNR